MPIRRTLKNVVNNFTDAQVKVREATSNDPWGPSSTIMGEIADLTYDVVAFTEIMQMIWKRLNDHGKNWRHVYKSLVLLDYIVKTGSEKVAQQCKENIYAIQTLNDFQYMEENKDQGINVREKAKQLVALLKDDERLKNERAKALKAKERFAQNSMGIGSDSQVHFGRAGKKESPRFGMGSNDPGASTSRSTSFDSSPSHAEPESTKPSSLGDEELQLQLALAISKEEYDQELKRKHKDDIKLHIAMEESKREMEQDPGLLDLATNSPAPQTVQVDPWGTPLTSPPQIDPWASKPPDPWASPSGPQPPVMSDPWASPSAGSSHSTPQRPAVATALPPPAQNDPWAMPAPASASSPWDSAQPRSMTNSASMPTGIFGSSANGSSNNVDDAFDLLVSRPTVQPTASSSMDPLGDMSSMNSALPPQKKTPEDFLGANKDLVNLDSLVSKPAGSSTNPFASSLSGVTNNPFGSGQPQRVPMNQMQSGGFMQPQPYQGLQPMVPMQAQNNPFL